MIMRIAILCTILLLQPSWCATPAPQSKSKTVRLLIIDSSGQQEYYYRNVILLAQSVGFKVTYKNFYDIIQNDPILDYDALFFFTSIDLLKNLKHDHGQKFIKILENLGRAHNKLIGFFSPATPRYNEMLFTINAAMLDTIGVFNDEQEKIALIKPAVHTFLKHMLQGDGQKGKVYGTTLLRQDFEGQALINQEQNNSPATMNFNTIIDKQTNEVIAALMPIKQDFSDVIKKTLPSGMYIKNNKSNTIYFLSKVSEFNFADIAENFFKTPFHLPQRNELLMVAQQMLFELHTAFVNQGMPINIEQSRPALPERLTLEFMSTEKKRAEININTLLQQNPLYDWIAQQGITCAWEAPADYELYEDPTIEQRKKDDRQAVADLQAKALESGIKFIYDAHINLIWFEFNPELFLSEHGLCKDKKQEFASRVIKIATAIKKQFENTDRPFPKIFMGTDITSNFRLYPVSQPAVDVFDRSYTKIPSPLDYKQYWKPELIDIFTLFYTTFNHQLPITGIFLDFEMYHAQDQAGAYTDLMDFSTTSWELYCMQNSDNKAQAAQTVPERVAYLIKHKAFNNYFSVLQHQATKLGQSIKKHLRSIMPNIIIGAYAMTLPSSWFYRGIMAGLSSEKEPLILATFNTDFYSHYQWLTDNNMHFIHGAPILLSKLQTQENFCIVPELLKYHYFAWYLRPSRMVYDRTQLGKIWWESEASPLDIETLAEGIAQSDNKL